MKFLKLGTLLGLVLSSCSMPVPAQVPPVYFTGPLVACLCAVLVACGGGGGGGETGLSTPPPVTHTVVFPPSFAAPPATVVAPVSPVVCPPVANVVACDLTSGMQPVVVPAGSYLKLTNNTGTYLQINSITATTGEQTFWSEFCAYLDVYVTGSTTAGTGEVGCQTKNIGENYAPITFGDGTGLSVEPGGVVFIGSHTEPALEQHTYSLVVAPQTSGLHVWRQPAQDAVYVGTGQTQSTLWSPWQNTTTSDLHLTGASIYAVSGTATPDTLNGPACVYVLKEDGVTQKYAVCDGLNTRGDVVLPEMIVSPGEWVVGQADNAAPTGANWDWVAYLRIW